jgi:hypothetical protein
MYDQPTVLRAFVKSACTPAIALSIIGMGVHSSWAGSDLSSPSNFTSLAYEVNFQPVSPSRHVPTLTTTIISSKRLITAQQCTGRGGSCPSGLNQQCCEGLACILNMSHTYPTAGQFEHICEPLFERGQACSSDTECASEACDNNPSAGADPTGNNYRLGLCE